VNLLPEEEQLVLRRPIVNPALKPPSIQDHHGWMEEIISARFPTTTNCTRTIVVNIYQIVELASFPWTPPPPFIYGGLRGTTPFSANDQVV